MARRRRLRYGPQRRIKIGTTDSGQSIFLPPEVREYSMHVMGAPGQGKSKFMEWLIRHDITNGEGLCLLDPHGSLYDAVVTWCAETQQFKRRTIHLFDLSAPGWRFGFNPLKLSGCETPEQVEDAIDGMVGAITQIWGGTDIQTMPRLARRLPAVLHALWANNLTLRESAEMCSKDELQQQLTAVLPNEGYRSEWLQYNTESDRDFVTNMESTRNRLAPFFLHTDLATMTGIGDVSIDFSQVIEDGDIVLVNLAGLSEKKKRMIGMLLVNDIFTKGIQRTPDTGKPFQLYLDECYYFLNDDIEKIIFGLRKFRIWLTLAHHTLGQLRKASDTVHDAVLQIPNKVLFGGLLEDDAKRLVMRVFLGEFNLEESKRTLAKPVVVGHRRETFGGGSHAHTEGTSSVAGWSDSTSSTETSNADSGLQALAETIASMASGSESESSSVTDTSSWSEGLVPILEERPTTVFSLEEQIYKSLVTLVQKPRQHAVLKLSGMPSVHIKTPTVRPSLITDAYVQKKKERVFGDMPFALQEAEAEAVLTDRRATLRKEIRRKAAELEPKDHFES